MLVRPNVVDYFQVGKPRHGVSEPGLGSGSAHPGQERSGARGAAAVLLAGEGHGSAGPRFPSATRELFAGCEPVTRTWKPRPPLFDVPECIG